MINASTSNQNNLRANGFLFFDLPTDLVCHVLSKLDDKGKDARLTCKKIDELFHLLITYAQTPHEAADFDDFMICKTLISFPKLQTISLSSVPQFSGSSLSQHPANLSHIRQITLFECAKLSDRNLATILKKMPNLEALSLGHNPKIKGTKFGDMSGAMSRLSRLTLCYLDSFTDCGFRQILNCSSDLIQLHLVTCPQISNLTLDESLWRCSKLQKLEIAGFGGLNSAFFNLGAKLPELKSLDLNGTLDITSEIFNQITSATTVTYLNLQMTELTADEVTDGLLKLKKLREIELDCAASNQLLLDLVNLPDLQSILLAEGSAHSQGGIKAARKLAAEQNRAINFEGFDMGDYEDSDEDEDFDDE